MLYPQQYYCNDNACSHDHGNDNPNDLSFLRTTLILRRHTIYHHIAVHHAAVPFVGNLQSGATGNVDVMLTGIAPTMDDGTVIMEISYEDTVPASYFILTSST